MKIPLISVIMSAYNAQRHISTAIKSILDQVYKNFEFIIINDGSTDDTLAIINSFTDDRIVLINKPSNEGLIVALNNGIEIAKGEFIARMDADDESLPQRFALQIAFMKNNPDIDALGTGMILIDGDKSKIMRQPKFHQKCLDALITGVCVFHPTVIIKKTILKNVEYNARYPHAEDYKLWVDLAKKRAKFANLPIPLLRYNIHGDNISITKFNEQKKSAQMAQKEYLLYLLGIDFSVELDLLFSDNQIASMREINKFYNKLSGDKKLVMVGFFRSYIKVNIKLLNYKLNDSIDIKLLFYYYRYKLKHQLT